MLTFSGCYYGYGYGYGSASRNVPKTTAAVDTIPTLSLPSLADDSGMFVFPGVTWGMTQSEVESALGVSFGDLTSFSDGGGYGDINVNYIVDGKVSVGMMPVFDAKGGLSSLSIYFEDIYTADQLDELYQDAVAEATAAFGDPVKVTPEDRKVSNTTYHTETTFWFHDVSETQQTSLQIGYTDAGRGTSAIVIGVNSYDPADVSEEESSEGESVSSADETEAESTSAQ
jgi:hypothetical protein